MDKRRNGGEKSEEKREKQKEEKRGWADTKSRAAICHFDVRGPLIFGLANIKGFVVFI